MAEIVATTHTIIAPNPQYIQNNVKGNKNNITPVTLFRRVCSTINLLVQTNPHNTFAILNPAITTIQIHNHIGTSISNQILIKRITTNIKSAIVSNFAPKALTVFVFLATIPSNKSDNPQNRYKT